MTLSRPVAVDEKRFTAAAKNSMEEKRGEREMRFLRARGPSELKQVASGSATQSLSLENRKVGSLVVGED